MLPPEEELQSVCALGDADDALTARNTARDVRPDGSESTVASIRVAVRARGLLQTDRQQGGRSIVKIMDEKLVVLMDPGITASGDYLRFIIQQYYYF